MITRAYFVFILEIYSSKNFNKLSNNCAIFKVG